MTQNILVGMAKYRVTGWRFVELASSLILMGIFINKGQYMGITFHVGLLQHLSYPVLFTLILSALNRVSFCLTIENILTR